MHPHEYLTMRATEDRHWWYAVLRRLVLRELTARLGDDARVLDAGCGTGGMMSVLRQRRPGWRLAGVDSAAAALASCLARGLDDVVRADVAALPFADAVFDAVLGLDVLYHQGVNETVALRELARVLRPGGWLVLNLPAFDCLRGAHDAAVSGGRRYTACQVRRRLEEHKLAPQMIHYWNAWLFLPLLLWRRWSRAQPGSRPVSDLRPLPRWLDAVLGVLGGADAAVCRALRLPFGSSVFAVARKPAETEGRAA